MLRVYGCTDVGQLRDHNEDNFLVADLSNVVGASDGGTATIEVGSGGVLLAVCDGMGGAAAGEIASQLAVDIIHERMARGAGNRDRDQLGLDIVEALEEAGVRILAESNKNRACRGMGTTATVAALVDTTLLFGQVGDSRAYVMRDGRLVQVTRDQSLVNQLIEAGQLTAEEAESFEHSNIILQALGTQDAVQVDLTYVELCRGDVLLICSDGLSGMVRNEDLRAVLLEHTDPAEACQVLVEAANRAGGHDNITVVVAVVEGEGLAPPAAEDAKALHYAKYQLPAVEVDRTADTTPHRRLSLAELRGDDDDTPEIEVLGELDMGPDFGWDDLLEDSPKQRIVRKRSWPVGFLVVLVAALVVVAYLILR